MNTTIIVGPEAFNEALATARDLKTDQFETSELGAPVTGFVKGKVAELWTHVEAALHASYRQGVEVAEDLTAKAISSIEEALKAAGKKASEIQALLLAKVRTYARQLIDGAMRQLAKQVSVDGVELALTEVSITQTLLLGGSLAASVTEIVSMTGSGQIAVGATYRQPQA